MAKGSGLNWSAVGSVQGGTGLQSTYPGLWQRPPEDMIPHKDLTKIDCVIVVHPKVFIFTCRVGSRVLDYLIDSYVLGLQPKQRWLAVPTRTSSRYVRVHTAQRSIRHCRMALISRASAIVGVPLRESPLMISYLEARYCSQMTDKAAVGDNTLA